MPASVVGIAYVSVCLDGDICMEYGITALLIPLGCPGGGAQGFEGVVELAAGLEVLALC